MNSESQKSDRLKSILEQARVTGAARAGPRAGAREAAAGDLLNRDAALPDPLALARLYQSTALRAQLPEDPSDSPGGAGVTAVGDAGAARPRADEPQLTADPGPAAASPARPAMTPSEMRAVMAQLQETFQVSDRSYETYEALPNPVDDLPIGRDERDLELAEAAEAAGGGTALYLLGAGLVLVVVIAFILLAVNNVGPFKPAPNHSPQPPASISP